MASEGIRVQGPPPEFTFASYMTTPYISHKGNSHTESIGKTMGKLVAIGTSPDVLGPGLEGRKRLDRFWNPRGVRSASWKHIGSQVRVIVHGRPFRGGLRPC